MNKLIYYTGIACANLMLSGALMKALHLAGSNILLVISIFIFCLGFLPTALISCYNNLEEKKSKWLYISTFIVFGIVFLSALFKILHWPGASVLMLIGIPLPFVVFLPVYLYHTRNDKSTFNLLGVIFGLTVYAVFSALLALNISSTVINSYAVSSLGNEKTAKFNQLQSNSLTYNVGIKQKSDEICAFIDDFKCKLLNSTNNTFCGNDKLNDDYGTIGIANLINTNTQVSFQFAGESISRMDILKSKLGDYQELISGTDKVSKEIKELSIALFNVSSKEVVNSDNETQVISWEEREFPATHLIIVLDVLSRIQSEVRFVESECLSAM